MNISELSDFSNCNDLVRTEEIIWSNLEKANPEIDPLYVFLKFPFADFINKRGTHYVQKLINEHCNKDPKSIFVFICQHIKICEIKFPKNSIVFTPHATIKDSYISIPHASPFDLFNIKPIDCRKFDFCFVGAAYTHPSRSFIFNQFSSNSRFNLIETGSWHFDKTEKEQNDNQNLFIDSMLDSKVSLCPRGTGPSTIRIWDSFAIGSIPLIISDGLKMPMSKEINWNKSCFFMKEVDVSFIDKINPYDYDLDSMIKEGRKLYKNFLCKNLMHNIIIDHINEVSRTS